MTYVSVLVMNTDRDTVSVGGAAKLLGKSTRTILRWTDAGILRVDHLTEGGHRRYLTADVEAVAQGRAA